MVSGNGESKGQPFNHYIIIRQLVNPGLPGKWPWKRCI